MLIFVVLQSHPLHLLKYLKVPALDLWIATSVQRFEATEEEDYHGHRQYGVVNVEYEHGIFWLKEFAGEHGIFLFLTINLNGKCGILTP